MSAFGGKADALRTSRKHKRSNAMSDIINEQIEDGMLETEISDEALESAAFARNFGIYTEFAYCTQVACPG